jgi:hypothetical protein
MMAMTIYHVGRMQEVLVELLWRNPQQNDGDAYEVGLMLWSLGFREDRPEPNDYGQGYIDQKRASDYALSLAELDIDNTKVE